MSTAETALVVGLIWFFALQVVLMFFMGANKLKTPSNFGQKEQHGSKEEIGSESRQESRT